LKPPKVVGAAPAAEVVVAGFVAEPKAGGAAGLVTFAAGGGCFCATEGSLKSNTGFGNGDDEVIGVEANG